MDGALIFNITIVLLVLLFITMLASIFPAWRLWFEAVAAGAVVNPYRIPIMRMRNIDPKLILENQIRAANSGVRIPSYKLEEYHLAGADVKILVEAKIKAYQAGIFVDIDFLKSHFLTGGDVNLIVNSKILADKAGVQVNVEELASHDLAKGNVNRVVHSMIIAKKADINLDFNRAAGIDLAGRDILNAVQMTVNPKVIKTEKVTAMAKDGIELTVSARVTVRMNLEFLVGGAGEDTVLARVGEGIVSTIGSAETHKAILENPQSISQKIGKDKLGKGTAFDILSLDIADVDVGRNIGAKHEVEKAEANTKIAQAEAERKEQEMRVRILEMRAKVLEAEAKVPLAMSTALKKGKLGVMDYYRMKNLRADIDMRHSFAKAGREQTDEDEGDERDERDENDEPEER